MSGWPEPVVRQRLYGVGAHVTIYILGCFLAECPKCLGVLMPPGGQGPQGGLAHIQSRMSRRTKHRRKRVRVIR